MNTQNSLDIAGTLAAFPFAELLVELMQTGLDGSLRLSRESEKAIIYFNAGRVVFGVSNSREHRLLNFLVRQKHLQPPIVEKYARSANDLELSASLLRDQVLTREAANSATKAQIEAILIDTLGWPDGEWVFSPVARVRSGLNFSVDVNALLMNYARCVPINVIVERFRSVAEAFSIQPGQSGPEGLLAHEAYLLARFGETPLKIGDIRNLCTLPESGMLQALYVLWLGGIIKRHDWNAAISSARLEQIAAAKLSLVKAASNPDARVEAAAAGAEKPAGKARDEAADENAAISLEEFLERSESAGDLYEMLGVPRDAATDLIKTRYFGLAKLFHPDRHHREKPETLRRIQNAFTRTAQAYETLKSDESRETYDYKLKKEHDARARRRAAGLSDEMAPDDLRRESGVENFEQGVRMFEEGEYAAAIALFARAVHYSPENAVFHANYGRALSVDKKQRHKAEAELQAGVKLDPANAEIRFMLVDFYIEMGMTKRAEGELTRFLDAVPTNAEARERLRQIQP